MNKKINITRTVEYEIDDLPTLCHILVVDNKGKCIRQITARETEGDSKEVMFERSCRLLLNNIIKPYKQDSQINHIWPNAKKEQ